MCFFINKQSIYLLCLQGVKCIDFNASVFLTGSYDTFFKVSLTTTAMSVLRGGKKVKFKNQKIEYLKVSLVIFGPTGNNNTGGISSSQNVQCLDFYKFIFLFQREYICLLYISWSFKVLLKKIKLTLSYIYLRLAKLYFDKLLSYIGEFIKNNRREGPDIIISIIFR